MSRVAAVWWGRFAAGLGPVDQDPDDVRRQACTLLNPTIACNDREPPRPPPDPPSAGFGAFAQLLVWALVLAMVAGLVWLVVQLVLRRSPRVRAESTDDDELVPLDDVIIDRSREPSSWREEAAHHAAAGRFRDALRCRYRALVGDLARRRLLDEIPGRTTGEERGQLVETAAMVAPTFTAAADLFDGAWYGDRPVGPRELSTFEAWESEVLARTHTVERSR